jgi:hypothetical protein
MLGALRSYIGASDGSGMGAYATVQPLPPEPGERVVPNPAAWCSDSQSTEPSPPPPPPPPRPPLPASRFPMQFALFLAYYSGVPHAKPVLSRSRRVCGRACCAGYPILMSLRPCLRSAATNVVVSCRVARWS